MFNKKELVILNVLNVAILLVIITVSVICSVNLLIAGALLLAWFVYVLIVNYKSLVRDTSIVKRLRRADRKNIFHFEVNFFIKLSKSVEFYEEVFRDADESVLKAYTMLADKANSNIEKAIRWMNNYDTVQRPPTYYIEKLVGRSEVLLDKFSELNELVLRINDETIHDVDITFVDAMLESLRDVLED